jgi:hypothetical protein
MAGIGLRRPQEKNLLPGRPSMTLEALPSSFSTKSVVSRRWTAAEKPTFSLTFELIIRPG